MGWCSVSNKDEGFTEKMTREMTEKSPAEAITDDLGGSGGPTDEQEENLEKKVDEKRAGDSGT
jgi:hypothetical protein